MRTPNPPWMSLSRTIGIKSAEKQRIRAGKLPAGSIPAPFEALGKTGGGLSCRKTASPRSTGHRPPAAGVRTDSRRFHHFNPARQGKVFPAPPVRTRLCVGFPISPATVRNAHWLSRFFPATVRNAHCLPPFFPPQQSEMRKGFPRFFPAAVVGHIHKLSPVLHCRTRLCVGFPISPRNSQKCARASPFSPRSSRKRRNGFSPRFPPAAEVIHPRAVCGDGGSGGGEKRTQLPGYLQNPFLRFLEGGAG